MKIIRLIGHLHSAIALVGLTAFFVIGGTLLEGWTGSHQYAAALTYNTIPFYLLLLGFFCNILISALLRWPFKKRHIPFLLTHLGLLMMILGTGIKGHYGIQGTMAILEGSGSNEVLLSGTQALSLLPRGHHTLSLKAKPSRWKLVTRDAPPIEARVVDRSPDGTQEWESWVKGQQASLQGLPPIPLFNLADTLPQPSAQIQLQSDSRSPWAFYALKATDDDRVEKKLLERHFRVVGGQNNTPTNTPPPFILSPCPIFTPDSYPACSPFLALIQRAETEEVQLIAMNEIGEIYRENFPHNELQSVVVYDEGYGGYAVQASLPFLPMPLDMTDHRTAVLFAIANEVRGADALAEPLQLLKEACLSSGDDFPNTLARLLSEWHNSGEWLYPADRPLSPELARPLAELAPVTDVGTRWASIILTEITEQTAQGADLIDSLKRLQWPLTEHLQRQRQKQGRITSDELPELLQQLTHQILIAAEQLPAPPEAPAPLSPAETFHFFTIALRTQGISLGGIAGEAHPDIQTIKTLYAAAHLRHSCCEALNLEIDVSDRHLIEKLQDLDPSDEPTTSIEDALVGFGKQIKLELPPQKLSTAIQAWLPPEFPYAAYEKSGLYLLGESELSIETPLARTIHSITPRTKIEERLPLLAVELRKGNQTERHLLPFDRTAQGLAWPALKGSLLLSFQPEKHLLPYQIRLRDARQRNYANSSQVESYEADLLITDRQGQEVEATLSMNNVYESPEGYRFYLSALTPDTERQAQRVQIVVNYDPAKYKLTYPGGILVAIGIFGLFVPALMERKKKPEPPK